MRRQMIKADTLLIDLDNTLIEYDRYFEEATEAFIQLLNHPTYSPVQVRAIVDEINVALGAGISAYVKSLLQTYRHLAENVRDEDVFRIEQLGSSIINDPVQILPGVPETLDYLAARYALGLLTKGEKREQEQKIQLSGLSTYFQHILIVEEKTSVLYTQMISDLHLQPHYTWMIGDSPRSDILPALSAGLQAIYIPNPHTWKWELQNICLEHERLLVLDTFSDLCLHF